MDENFKKPSIANIDLFVKINDMLIKAIDEAYLSGSNKTEVASYILTILLREGLSFAVDFKVDKNAVHNYIDIMYDMPKDTNELKKYIEKLNNVYSENQVKEVNFPSVNKEPIMSVDKEPIINVFNFNKSKN